MRYDLINPLISSDRLVVPGLAPLLQSQTTQLTLFPKTKFGFSSTPPRKLTLYDPFVVHHEVTNSGAEGFNINTHAQAAKARLHSTIARTQH
jgi:hypothetical protein